MCARPGPRPAPSYASSLIGRESELDLLEGLIADPDTRLITLSGIAGIGKTRIASHIVREMGGPDSVFVSLSTVTDTDLVVPEIGLELGLQGDNLADAIRNRLENLSGIVVLDNFEQVIEAAPQIADLLPDNPELTVIITSQRPLEIGGERVVRMMPLQVPQAELSSADVRSNPSVQLLIDRATSQDPSMNAAMDDESTAQAVAEICRRLDGIPLALELAASRLAVLTPEVVLAELDRGQKILSSTRRDTPERHRTMQSAIGWSVDLLAEDSRRTFIWLGAFTAGFDLEIIERVSLHLGNDTDAIDTVSELMQLSLVRRLHGGANPWYAMLTSIREYCLAELDRTDEREDAEALVGEYTLDFASEASEHLSGHEGMAWRVRIEVNLPTIRSAVAWSLSREEPALPMLVGYRIGIFFEQTGRWRESAEWITEAETWREKLTIEDYVSGLIGKMQMLSAGRDLVDASATQSTLRDLLQEYEIPELEAEFLLGSSDLALRKHLLTEAEADYERALFLNEELGETRNIARANANLGHLAYLRGDFVAAEALLAAAVATFRDVGDASATSSALQNLANTANLQNKTEEALTHLEEAIAISRENDLIDDLLHALLSQVVSLIDLQRLDEAMEVATEVVELGQQHDFAALVSQALYMLGGVAYLKEDYPAAAGYLLTALDQTTVDDMPELHAEIGNFLASSLAKAGRYPEAIAIQAGYDSFVEKTQYRIRPEAGEMRGDTMKLVEQHLSDAEDHYAAGRGWTTEEWVNKLKQQARKLAVRSKTLLIAIPEPDSLSTLTTRENEVVGLLIDGQSTQEMAHHLSVSPRTITTHLGNIMGKLEVSSRAELVAKILQRRNQATQA